MNPLRIVQTVDDGGGRHGRFRSDRRTKPQDANTKPSLIELVRLDSGHKHADMHRFVKLLVARQLLLNVGPELDRESLTQLLREAKKAWHGVKLNQPDWGRSSHSLALTAEIEITGGRLLLHLILNAYWEPLDFELPPLDKECEPHWRRSIDTALDPPHDIADRHTAPAVLGSTYRAEPHSVIMLIANPILP